MTTDERTGYRSGDRRVGVGDPAAGGDRAASLGRRSAGGSHRAMPGSSPVGDAAPSKAGDPPSDPSCERCGGIMIGRHCKLVCSRCGYQRDCSDP